MADIPSTNERVEVWYLIGSLEIGGAEKTLIDLVSGLDRDQFSAVIWTITDAGSLSDDVPDHVPVHSLGAHSKTNLSAPISFLRTLRKEQPDILQSFLFFDNTLAKVGGLISPQTTIVTGVRAVPNDQPLLRSVVDQATVNLSDHIVSNSMAGKKWIMRYGANPKKVSVIPNGRNVSKYYEASASEELRSELGATGDPIVGTVGRLVERKGGLDLLDAWPHVASEHPNAQLLFVGDGPIRDRLSQRAIENNCSDSVLFAGQRDDVPELLDLMDVFVFPSHYEGLPGALLEAMCAGLPIVTTPVDGCSELVRDEQEGIHVPPQNSEKLQQSIRHLIRDKELATELSDRAHKRAKQEFSLEKMTTSFETLYTDLVA